MAVLLEFGSLRNGPGAGRPGPAGTYPQSKNLFGLFFLSGLVSHQRLPGPGQTGLAARSTNKVAELLEFGSLQRLLPDPGAGLQDRASRLFGCFAGVLGV